MVLGQAALRMADDPQFRSVLYQEIEKQFDGDYNVLFEHLQYVRQRQNTYPGARMTDTHEIGAGFLESIDAFKGIEGTDYYPQIYIPYYEALNERKGGSANMRVSSDHLSPVLVLYADDNPDDAFPGYQLDADGNLVDTGMLIDEEYAQNNEVWVMSLNESTCAYDSGVPEICDPKSAVGGGSSHPGGGGGTVAPSARIYHLGIRCRKERWLGGKSEVRILVALSTIQLKNPIYQEFRRSGPYEWTMLINMHRKDVKKGKGWDIKRKVVDRWNDRWPDQTYISYCIFEYDAWPRGRRQVEFHNDGGSLYFDYRSGQSPYDQKTAIHQSNLSKVDIDNGCIFYTARYQ